ncbi:hypothetical protein [Nocardioides sambongensis]|uniref:hypothetical protein n=1 Tax=Nocardioides sambongensis TaxID=2589074 RepID=UPI0011260AD1|nr:hypothetical protein [Nocardioides sambongensis]
MSAPTPRWSRYRPDRRRRDEAGRYVDRADATDPDATPAAGARDALPAESGLSVSTILFGAVFVVALVVGVLGGAVLLTADDSDGPDLAPTTSAPPAPAPPPEPLDPDELTTTLTEFAAAPEVRGLSVAEVHLSPDRTTVDFYDPRADRTVELSANSYEPGYTVRVREPSPRPAREELFDLDLLRPSVLVTVSAQGLERATDPRWYGVIVVHDPVAEQVQISDVVSQADDTSLVLRADLDGKIVDEAIVD